MSKILGLDLGTNSIGWAIVDDKKEGNKLEDKGVLIFSEGVKRDKNNNTSSKAAERTGFRGARRLNFRRKIRKHQTLLVLAKHKMCPLTEDEVKEWRKSNFKKYPTKPKFLNWLKTDDKIDKNPYYFRNKASREKVTKYELGRAFYHIAQRRGFLSNRLDQSDKGVVEKHQPEIETRINESANVVEIQQAINEYFESFDILEKKQKDLNAGEQKLKSLYNSFKKLYKEKIDTDGLKLKLKERLYKKENLGAVKKGITELDDAIDDAKCETLGQYFWKLYQEDRNNVDNKIRNKYTSREEHYLHEFEIICNCQGLESIDKSKKDANERYGGIIKELYKAIFYQRPLKSQKGLIGKCSLEPNRTRCAVSRPEFEEFRMFSFINTIKIKTDEDKKFRFLYQNEREKIETKFYRKSKPTFAFEDIKNTLGKGHTYNYKDRVTVSGCPTISNLRIVFGEEWKNTLFENYTDKTIRNRKTGEILGKKTIDDVIADIWHILSTYTSEEKLKDFAIKKLNADTKTAEKFAKIHLKKDYANLSLYAINKILPYLKNGLLYSHAVFMANMNKVVKPERWENKDDRELIEKEVGNIIKNHREESKVVFIINSLLSNCYNRENNFNYSKEAENGFKDDLEKALKKEFGAENLEKKNKEELFSTAFKSFIAHLKERKYIAVKRIDEKIIAFLNGENENGEIFCEDENLLKELYHPSDIEKFKASTIIDKDNNEYKGLGSPDVGSIKNPMAMKALHQLKKLINTLIIEGQIDEHTKINIELSRQLNDANKRKAIEKWQNDRKELYQVYAEKIKELYPKENNGKTIDNITNSDIEKFAYVLEQREDGKTVSKEDILKYTLWEEQNHICLYTGETINLSNFLGENPSFDIEHTLPRKRSWDNSQMNKTLCKNTFNRDDKGNKTPFELPEEKYNKILPRIKHWKAKYEGLADEIEKLKRQSRSATEKEQKDRLIQKRHYLKMEHDYWKGKYSRFIMEKIKEGFKNSQTIDIGIITKYARAYLKSVFNKVYSVKGEMVSEYRKAWGINITKPDENGRPVKNRDNHIHHCIDAVTIACMNKNRYDKLAHAWGLEDKGEYKKAKLELEKEKPWKSFTEDMRNLENEVFIVHHNRNVLPIQTKKKFRKRGKVQYRIIDKLPADFKDKKEGKDYFVVCNNGKTKYKVPIFLQGDTVRGSLHQDTFYGAIAKGKEGAIQKDEYGKITPNYVVRKELKNLKKTDVTNIVDDNIRGIVEQATKDKLIAFNKNGAKVNATIWQNKEKQIPLKKVRIYTPSVRSPLRDFKKHAIPFLSEKEYKQQFNVVNDENYCMAIYEGVNEKGKLKRDFELVNNIDAGEYYKLSNKKDRKEKDISLVPRKHIGTGLPLKYQNFKPFIIKKGVSVILLKDDDENTEWGNQDWLKNRLYILSGIDKDGIKLIHNQEARMGTDTIRFMNDIINKQKFEDAIPELENINDLDVINRFITDFANPEIKKKDLFNSLQQTINDYYKENSIVDKKGKLKSIKLKESGLTTPKGGDVIDNYKSFPYVKFKPSGFYAKLENIDFIITPTGKIEKL